jgi:hypothetical protein
MADENKPAFYPRVGNIKAKNFKPAQPMPFVYDERAMELPDYKEFIPKLGTVDLSVPSKENLELNRRITERDADLMRQVQADRSPLEKLAGGLQAGRFLGSALTQAVNSLPTRIFKGDEAADKFMQERMYKPEQPLAYEYAGDVGDFLEKLETEYKIPPLMPEALPLQFLSGPATAQAARAAGRGAEQVGRKLESAMEPVVKGAFERGGLPREMVMAMGANTQSNVIKPYGGNWLGGGDQLALPENDLRRLKGKVGYSLEPEAQLKKLTEKYTPEALARLTPDIRVGVERAINETRDAVAVNRWIDSNLTNYVKKEMGTPDDPVRRLAEEGIVHTPLRNDLDRMEYLQAIRKAEGYPAEGMGKSDLAKQWENITDDSIRVTKAGKIQDAKNISERVEQARAEIDAYTKELDKNFLARMSDHTGNEIFTPKEAEMLMRMPEIQKAEILGDTRYKELKDNLYELLAREQGFEKRAGELNPFVAKLDPETRLYSGSTYELGFDHIIDVLKEDVASGRIRPEQLNKVSMEQAVRRTYEYDQELAKKMAETRLTARAELPVYKEYPEGLKWVELNRPGDFAAESDAMGHSVRGYEPPEGHPDWTKNSGDSGYSSYGHGGWDAIKRGDAKVYSLIDSKGEPHVTVEAHPSKYALRWDVVKEYMPAATEEAKKLPHGYTDRDISDIAMRMAKENEPFSISQIKGKQNAAPKADYLPFVQDFVKSGKWSNIGDFKNTGLIREGNQLMTPAEHADWLLKELGADTYNELGLGAKPPPAAGMKAGGKVSISNNPDTMMLAVNNQKMKNGEPAYAGGKLIVGKGLKAAKPPKIEVPRLSMQFGNDLPINMNTAEVENLARRFPEPTVDRVNMAHKDVLKRTPELQEAAARIEAGDISADEYARLVQRYKPVTPYESVPAPASREEILAALSKTSREAEGLPRKETYFGKPSSTLKEGDPVGLRLDIPSYNQANTWVVTAHGPRKSPVSGGAGTRIGYEPVAMATDVDFSVSPKAALGIAKGAEKNTIATMEGKWKPTSSDEAFTLAKQYLKNPEWRQVGMDPERHSFFYDRETMAPVVNAEEVIQIGPLVLAKNPKFGKLEDFKYAGGGLTGAIKQGLKAAKPEVMKASEALGKIEGRPLKITQADRTKVGGGYLGGPGFSGLQLTEPEYRAAEAAWAVQNAGTAKTILGGEGDNAVYAAMLGTPTQHQSNQMVFDKLLGDFKKAAKRGELTPELRDLINMRLAAAVDNKGNPVFPANVDIMDKKFRDVADTFSRRSVAGHLMGGVQVGGKKGQIIDYDKIIRSTTDPVLLDQPTGALGNRLFTLSGGIINRPDLHPAFPTILQGEDLGVMFTPVERDIVMKDFVEKTMREKGRKPGYMDYTRGNPPTQLITEDILTELQKLGKKKGGLVKKEGGYIKKPAAYIDGNEFVLAAQKYGIKDSMNNLNKIVDLVNKGLSVDDAAQQVADSGMHKAAGGAIRGDDLILEERPL